jgi:tRNA-dihydrouridine synthase C
VLAPAPAPSPRRAEQGGARWITIHGRTKTQGYIPPAYWKPIGEVKRALSIPVIANGEIFSLEDFKKCREETGSIHYMIGRGALAKPHLAKQMREALGLGVIAVPNPLVLPEDGNPKSWAEAFLAYSELQPSEKRLKQWVRYLASKQSIFWWDEIKGLGSVTEILNHLRQLPEVQSSASQAVEHP